MSTAHQNENAERITRSIDSDLMMLAALTLIVAALDEHVGCTDPFFITQPTACLCISAVRRRAIAPQDNVSDHRVRTMIMRAEKTARKPDFACIALLSTD